MKDKAIKVCIKVIDVIFEIDDIVLPSDVFKFEITIEGLSKVKDIEGQIREFFKSKFGYAPVDWKVEYIEYSGLSQYIVSTIKKSKAEFEEEIRDLLIAYSDKHNSNKEAIDIIREIISSALDAEGDEYEC